MIGLYTPPFQIGECAYRCGKPESANPYDRSSESWLQWRQGWHFARAKNQLSD